MKKYLVLSAIICLCLNLYAQTEGLSYQAVIINPNSQELPGVNARDNVLPDTDISIRFTIFNAVNKEEFQEVQDITTDRFGMVNLMIGSTNKDGFGQIDWDGTVKDLKVEIDFDGSGGNFMDISRQQLTFIPYAYHRNIKATGTLTVDETTDLNGVLQVHGIAQLNSSLEVTGQTTLKNRLTANDIVNFKDSLFVDSVATFKGSAAFEKEATFGSSTKFKSVSIGTDEDTPNNANDTPLKVFGKVEIDANNDLNAVDNNMNNYPLLIKGSTQGLAIQVKGERSSSNNYVSFWDEDANKMWGRIEGQTTGELLTDPEYITETTVRTIDLGINLFEVTSIALDVVIKSTESALKIADTRPCVGVGACLTVPNVGLASVSVVEVVKFIADLAAWVLNSSLAITEGLSYQHFQHSQIGVAYQSGSSDYAEWLPKDNINDQFVSGELVGVKNGLVSKHVFGADRVMVISTSPIVLGNMQQEKDESKFEKIAFMGQVPVRVVGDVKPGDYILPHELMLGFAKAVHPEKMATRDYKKIVGIAWNTISQQGDDLCIVNVAVGINTNDLADVMLAQKEELNTLWAEFDALKEQVDKTKIALAKLIPGYTDYINVTDEVSSTKTANTIESVSTIQDPDFCPTCPEEVRVIKIEFTREQLEMGFKIAIADYQKMFNDASAFNKLIPPMPKLASDSLGLKSAAKQTAYASSVPMEEHPFWGRINSDPTYKEEIVQYIKTNLSNAVDRLNIENDSVAFDFDFKGF